MQEQKVPYLRSVQQELKKVSWTSKEELLLGTKVVIISTFIFGMAIYIADLFINRFLSFLGHVAYFITG